METSKIYFNKMILTYKSTGACLDFRNHLVSQPNQIKGAQELFLPSSTFHTHSLLRDWYELPTQSSETRRHSDHRGWQKYTACCTGWRPGLYAEQQPPAQASWSGHLDIASAWTPTCHLLAPSQPKGLKEKRRTRKCRPRGFLSKPSTPCLLNEQQNANLQVCTSTLIRTQDSLRSPKKLAEELEGNN